VPAWVSEIEVAAQENIFPPLKTVEVIGHFSGRGGGGSVIAVV
jgi:hypothetical protein